MAIKSAAVAAVGLGLPSCSAFNSASSESASVKKEDNSVLNPLVKRWLERGLGLRTAEDTQMLNETYPGIDLTFSGNPRVESILKLSSHRERIVTAIGFLDVENSRRYNWITDNGELVYACNVYALDSLRLLLGNEVIGSRYRKVDGAPWCFGIESPVWAAERTVDINFKEYPFLNSNILNWWMKKYGVNFGWEMADPQIKLGERLKDGWIGLGVSSDEKIAREIALDPTFLGHAFVVFSLGESFGVTQATRNVRLETFPVNSTNPKVNPGREEYRFWIHRL